MHLDPSQWHARYSLQARWTQPLRQYLFAQIHLSGNDKILDVGCGTGVLDPELSALNQSFVVGVDISEANIGYAKTTNPEAVFSLGDAHRLPFPARTFAIALCHFLLLWVEDPSSVLREMVRVTRPGGTVLALAEPDYGGRIDYPPALAVFGEWQQASLRQQGADPFIGRRLGSLFHQSGLVDVETGVLGGQWRRTISKDEFESEWLMRTADLEELYSEKVLDAMQAELTRLRKLEEDSIDQRERLLFIPTFYASGRKLGAR